MYVKRPKDSASTTSGQAPSPHGATILLFVGTGTSPSDVAAIETILDGNHLNYSTANSSQLNKMSESQIGEYQLLIFPGGNFIDMGKSLTSGTVTSIGAAVHRGSNYLGICAGGFLAGHSNYYNGLNLTTGVNFGFYSAERRGLRKLVVSITVAGGSTLDQYWEDGPQFTGWGLVIARYPDRTPAIVEGTYGNGWVILSGIHAEAPDDWRHGLTFTTPASVDNIYAATLVRATLNRKTLPHY